MRRCAPGTRSSSRTRAQPLGFFFNDGSNLRLSDGTGDVLAGLQLQRDSTSGDRIMAFFGSETRRYWITSDIDWLGAKASWGNLQSLDLLEPRREINEKVEIERRYYLASLPADGVCFSEVVRQHWGVESGLHWVLDVHFNEDACWIGKDKGAQTFSVLRHIALNLLKRESKHKRGIKARRKRAGWDRGYLLQV